MTKNTNSSLRCKTATDYDSIADEWDRARQGAWGEFNFARSLLTPAFAKATAGRPPDPPPARVGTIRILDAGCGNGRLLKWLDGELKDYEYLGIDNSVGLLEKAQKNFPQRKFQKADLTEFSKPNNFDLIACVAVLHHLPSRAERLKVLKNFQTSLAPGGRLFLTVWNLWQPRYWKYVLIPQSDVSRIFNFQFSIFNQFPMSQFLKDLKSLPQALANNFKSCRIPFAGKVDRYVHAFTKSELKNLLQATGFQKIEIFHTAGENKAGIFTGRNITCFAEK